MTLRRPIRSLRMALRYWKPYRLTLDIPGRPDIRAWLWWNYEVKR